jgi:hypothetical protein
LTVEEKPVSCSSRHGKSRVRKATEVAACDKASGSFKELDGDLRNRVACSGLKKSEIFESLVPEFFEWSEKWNG